MDFFPQPYSPSLFLQKALQFFSAEQSLCLLNSNDFKPSGHPFKAGTYDFLLGAGAVHQLTAGRNTFDQLKLFYEKHKGQWMFGYFTYDLKNELEQLSSGNYDGLQFPAFAFFYS